MGMPLNIPFVISTMDTVIPMPGAVGVQINGRHTQKHRVPVNDLPVLQVSQQRRAGKVLLPSLVRKLAPGLQQLSTPTYKVV